LTGVVKLGIECVLKICNQKDWVLNNKFCKNARDKVVKLFDGVVVAKIYISLYEGILKND
jgi:hypothetical protein